MERGWGCPQHLGCTLSSSLAFPTMHIPCFVFFGLGILKLCVGEKRCRTIPPPSTHHRHPFYYVTSMQTYPAALDAWCCTQVKRRPCRFQLSFSMPVHSAAGCCFQPLCRDNYVCKFWQSLPKCEFNPHSSTWSEDLLVWQITISTSWKKYKLKKRERYRLW